jgi:hypothetical protein
MTTLMLAGYVLLMAAISAAFQYWNGRQRLRLPDQADNAGVSWYLPAQALVALVVAVLSLALSLEPIYHAQTLSGPLALGMLIAGGVLLTLGAPERDHNDVRRATMALAVLVLVELGWALLPLDLAALGLHRWVILMTALALITGVSAIAHHWLPQSWAGAAWKLAPLFGGATALTLLVVLGMEATQFQTGPKRAPVEPWAVTIVLAAMAGVIAASIRLALSPRPDPLHLPDSRRTLYVYAAEVFLFLSFVHFKLTVPFVIGPYWTFVVMAVAFGGVGLSELFQRRGLAVLAGPLQSTGIFLPLFPLLAIWLKPSAEALLLWAQQALPGAEPFLLGLSRLPQAFNQYALLWFLTGVLLSVVALSRQSFRFAVLAALAGNFALWSLWRHTELSFLIHPQLWLIPLALILLVAEHLNRDRLAPPQSLGLRYAGLGMIYLSSTADMFIAGLGKSLWLPLALMLLSVLGVLLGILLRVRAYLFLGISFLFLVIFSQIWHAAVDLAQTWVWWASGIVLGVAILSLFAVFEKRRNDILLMLEEIKQWR